MSRFRTYVADSFAAELERLESEGKIEHAAGLKIHHGEIRDDGRCYLKVWRGKAKKPFANYSFRSVGQRSQWIAELIESEQQRHDAAAQRKADKAQRIAEMRETIAVGMILHRSWGYDQTTNDFYQVVERRGAYAVIRKIGKVEVAGSEGFMCCRVKPNRDDFTSEPMRKLIGEWGVSIGDRDHATPIVEGREYSETWYA